MIHGAQGDQTMFAGLASACAAGFRVLTFDQRGSGLSEKPDIDYSIAMLADDTAALIDHVGLSPAHVIGVSMGGMIAQELALRHPGKVRSLVLGCTTPGGPHEIRAEGNALAAAYSLQPMSPEERGAALAQAVYSKGHLARHPEIIAAMIEARRGRPIDPVALGHRMKALSEHDTYDRLPKISCPTLVITGKDDVLVSWENSRLLAERIPAPSSRSSTRPAIASGWSGRRTRAPRSCVFSTAHPDPSDVLLTRFRDARCSVAMTQARGVR
jgi:pimeloyl-ACP methyl ester carboxylesterase